jgi:hypothetical protein
MTDLPPRAGMFERVIHTVRTLTLTNILMIALLLLIAVPVYFIYHFMTDDGFRRELLSRAIIIDKNVPCIVLVAHRYGSADRYTVGLVYGFEGRMERIIALRAPGTLTDQEIEKVCDRVVAIANEMKR